MRAGSVLVATAMACATLVTTPVRADDDAKKVAIGAAVAALGVAAIAHHKHHHKVNEHTTDARHEEDFERGYHDALYSEHFDTRSRSDAYREGYDAGVYERENRTNHYRVDDDHQERHGAPSWAQRICVGEASAQWGMNPRDIVPVKSRQLGGDDYRVEVAAGYRHGTCEIDGDGRGDGRVTRLNDGRI